MRYRLLILFMISGFSASSQLLFWKKTPPFHPRPLINLHSIGRASIMAKTALSDAEVKPFVYDESEFSLLSQERALIKDVRHNMSWRIYNVASYNFSDLGLLYIKMHRYSEAKWYFLQSINISRQENNDRHTIANLVSLAGIKENLGDLVSARNDLNEAQNLAQARGMKEKTEEIKKMIPLLGQNKILFANRYAETAVDGNKDL